jgi:quinol monooxygenase YgiN
MDLPCSPGHHTAREKTIAYVIIVEFRAKPEGIQAFAELIDRHAHNSPTLEDGCPAFDVCQDPDDPARFVFYEAYREQEAHRQHLVGQLQALPGHGTRSRRARLRERPTPPPPSADAPPVSLRVA